MTSLRSSAVISPHSMRTSRDARVDADALLDLPLDLGAQRAAADRQLDGDPHDAVVVDADRRHHAQRDDVGAELGIDDGFEDGAHLVRARGGSCVMRRAFYRRSPCNLVPWSHASRP